VASCNGGDPEASDLAFDDFRDVGTGYGDRPTFRAGVPWQDAEAVMSDGDALGHEGEGWPELLQELAGDLGDRRTSALTTLVGSYMTGSATKSSSMAAARLLAFRSLNTRSRLERSRPS
jgi:hypothetical protein